MITIHEYVRSLSVETRLAIVREVYDCERTGLVTEDGPTRSHALDYCTRLDKSIPPMLGVVMTALISEIMCVFAEERMQQLGWDPTKAAEIGGE